MSEDPKLFDAGDYNLFRYCHNDPIDNVDPMGLADERREPWYNHQEQAKQLGKLQALLNQKLLLGYGAISVGGLQYAVTQLQQTMGDTTNFHMAQVGVEKKIPISIGKPDKDGLVTYTKELYTKSVEAARHAHEASMQDGMERHLSGFYNSDESVTISRANIGIGKPWSGPQIGRGPDPGPGQSLASTIHSHTNQRLMGGEDFLKSNTNHIPGFVGLLNGRVQVYVPLFNARPTGVQQGSLFFAY